MDIKVMIVDDNDGMRLILKKVVEKVDGFELISEVTNAKDAINYFEENEVDVIFMDIEMEGMNGIECAKKIVDIDPSVKIIFATGHAEFMSEAFELYAFDYLVKPFNMERLNKTLMRIQETDKNVEEPKKIEVFSRNIEKVVIKNKEGINFLNAEDIVLVQREDRSTVVCTKAEKYITSESLTDFEEKLPKDIFLRSHKSYIINISKISKISSYGRWTYIVEFVGTERDALITHKQYEVLEKMLGI